MKDKKLSIWRGFLLISSGIKLPLVGTLVERPKSRLKDLTRARRNNEYTQLIRKRLHLSA